MGFVFQGLLFAPLPLALTDVFRLIKWRQLPTATVNKRRETMVASSPSRSFVPPSAGGESGRRAGVEEGLLGPSPSEGRCEEGLGLALLVGVEEGLRLA